MMAVAMDTVKDMVIKTKINGLHLAKLFVFRVNFVFFTQN
jgi:hypothetical protein